MTDDAELLRRYAGSGDESAFAELVRRHLGLVYHAALRQCGGDAHRAEDVAQAVFTDLARKARKLARHTVLAGWLYTSTRYAATQAVRTEARRQAREREAHAMNEVVSEPAHDTDTAAEWERLRPVIDDALHTLGERDREAVLLRFFEGRALAEVGAKLAVSEDAARMRIDRALEKMRTLLVRRGVTSTHAALAAALANQAALAAPAGLATTVTGAALAGGCAAAAGVGAWVTFMGMTKLQVGIAGALVLAGTAGFVVQSGEADALNRELAELNRRRGAAAVIERENRTLARVISEKEEAARAQVQELAHAHEQIADLRKKVQAASAARVARPVETRAAPEPFTGPYFEPRQVEVQAKPVHQTVPLYPAELRKLGLRGEAVIDFIVDPEGRVRNASVRSATQTVFGDAAIEAMNRWQFSPAQKDGRPVAIRMQMPMVFTLVDDSKPAKQPPKPPVLWF